LRLFATQVLGLTLPPGGHHGIRVIPRFSRQFRPTLTTWDHVNSITGKAGGSYLDVFSGDSNVTQNYIDHFSLYKEFATARVFIREDQADLFEDGRFGTQPGR